MVVGGELGQAKVKRQELHPSPPRGRQGPKYLDYHLLQGAGSEFEVALPYEMLASQGAL